MKLTELLTEDDIVLPLDAEDPFEAIEELVDHLISLHELSIRDRDRILDVVFQRERSMSTGIGGGIAIPHGTVDCIDDIVGAIGVSPKGIGFHAADGSPVHTVILLLVPKSKINRHIKTMAQIARVFNDPKVRDQVRTADSSAAILDCITRAEREHEQTEKQDR